MKTKGKYTNGLMLLSLFLIAGLQTTAAQEKKVSLSESSLTVFGTSNVHDWDVKANEIQSSGVFVMEEGALKDIERLTLTIPTEGLKSGKSGMDKNTYKALNSDKHKNIVYRLTKVNKVTASGTNKYKVETSGSLAINGVTKTVSLTFDTTVNGNAVTLKGKTTFPMTQYDVKPPTALMGTIKTGDEVTIDFDVTYK